MGGSVAAVDARRSEGDSTAPVGPSRRGKRRVVAWVAGFLLTIIVAELAVRVVSERLDDPLYYFSPDAERVVNDMDILESAGVQSDLTFVGTSMVRRDVAVNDLEGELDGVKWAHNVALPGAQTPVVERWMLDEVVPRLHPKRVVWGISSIDFNSGRPNKTIDQYVKARASEDGFYAEADRILWNVALSRYRDDLRDPVRLQHGLSGTGRDFEVSRPLRDRATWDVGFAPRTAAEQARGRANHKRTVRDKQLVRFKLGDEEMASYLNTLETLQDQGTEVAVVIMPVPSGFLELHPNGEDDFLQWTADVTAAAEEIGVPVIDMSRSMPDDGFRDYEHLNTKPAHEFTAKLHDELEGIGW
jgi:hypothetical protein